MNNTISTKTVDLIYASQDAKLPVAAAYCIRAHCWTAPPSGLDCKKASAKPEPYATSGFVYEIYTQFIGICEFLRRPPPRLDSQSHPHFTRNLKMKMTAAKSGSIAT